MKNFKLVAAIFLPLIFTACSSTRNTAPNTLSEQEAAGRWQQSPAFFVVQSPEQAAINPAGNWNKARIRLKGGHIGLQDHGQQVRVPNIRN